MRAAVMNTIVGLRKIIGGRDAPRGGMDVILREQSPAAQDQVVKMKSEEYERATLGTISATTDQMMTTQHQTLNRGRLT